MKTPIPVAIVPVLNRFDLLEGLLRSLDYPIENLLIIDNSDSYSIPEGFDFHPALEDCKMKVLNLPTNFGVAGSWNLGIRCYPHSPYWLFMSNDNHWEPGGLEEMAELSAKEKLVMSNVAWNAFSLGSDFVRKIGLFDENYYPAYYEDTDYMERIRFAEMLDQIVWSTAPIRSLGAATTVKSDEALSNRNKDTNDANSQYFQNKIYSANEHVNCFRYDIDRRIAQDWFIY